MMKPQASVDIGNRAIGIFKIGNNSSYGALLARLFDFVICTVPQTTTFAHDVLDHHFGDVVRSITERFQYTV